MSIAIMVGRFQPLHFGHCHMIYKMLLENETVIIGIGSAQYSTEDRKDLSNPFTLNERKTMIKNVFGDSSKIKLVNLVDQGCKEKNKWIEYVLHCLDNMSLDYPDKYYGGSELDLSWIKYYNDFTDKKILPILIDRYKEYNISGTEIRKHIINECADWIKYVPEVNHKYIKEKFPVKYILSEILKKKGEKYE